MIKFCFCSFQFSTLVWSNFLLRIGIILTMAIQPSEILSQTKRVADYLSLRNFLCACLFNFFQKFLRAKWLQTIAWTSSSFEFLVPRGRCTKRVPSDNLIRFQNYSIRLSIPRLGFPCLVLGKLTESLSVLWEVWLILSYKSVFPARLVGPMKALDCGKPKLRILSFPAVASVSLGSPKARSINLFWVSWKFISPLPSETQSSGFDALRALSKPGQTKALVARVSLGLLPGPPKTFFAWVESYEVRVRNFELLWKSCTASVYLAFESKF